MIYNIDTNTYKRRNIMKHKARNEHSLTLGTILFLICLTLFTASMTDINAKADTSNEENNYQVIRLTASDLKENPAQTIRTALEEARDFATEQKPYKIIVAPGEYTLNYSLHIYSNTYLYSKGVTYKKLSSSTQNMIHIGTRTSEKGYYYQNITIDGGIWNGNKSSNTLMKLEHAQNVTIKNLTLQSTANAHIMEVAGLNGLTITNCKFKDQALKNVSDNTNTYEAIQLDIPETRHMGGSSEDLANKNISIDSCSFSNLPRAIGSHTAILNNPLDTISITNCTFNNIKSVAIQSLGWINITISNNTIQNSPRGIAIYSTRAMGGTYFGSTLAAQAKMTSKTSKKYITPASNQNIVITNNTISTKGSDPYIYYEPWAIALYGENINKNNPCKGVDKMPYGDYYISGVTISGNTITTHKSGIRAADCRNTKIFNNTISYTGTAGSQKYGIQLCNNSKTCSVYANKVLKGSGIGIYLNSNGSASSIKQNTIQSPLRYGIFAENASVSNVSDNTVTSSGISGIYAYKKASMKTVSGNKISSPKKYGIAVDNAVIRKIMNNTITKSGNNGINAVHKGKVVCITGNKISYAKARGICINTIKSNIEVSQNTIQKCSKELIHICPNPTGNAKKYLVTITDNTLTGKSKKQVGINIIESQASVSKNTIQSCKVSIYFNAKSCGKLGKNKCKKNKTNKIQIGGNLYKCPKKLKKLKVSGNTIRL